MLLAPMHLRLRRTTLSVGDTLLKTVILVPFYDLDEISGIRTFPGNNVKYINLQQRKT